MRQATWIAVIGLAAATAIVSHEGPGGPWLHWIAKPATTLLIVAMALTLAGDEARYRRWIVGGLLLSTLGDVFLMLPGDWFIHGLASFLLAHLAYLVAFTARVRLWAVLWPYALFALLGGLVLSQLWPGVPADQRIAVVIYVIALAAMAAQASVVWRIRPGTATAAAALGGAAFLCSDAILAWNRFAEPVPAAKTWVLTSYWLAQYLIARSVGRA
jgi:uncharacterized membrane protein YhhN